MKGCERAPCASVHSFGVDLKGQPDLSLTGPAASAAALFLPRPPLVSVPLRLRVRLPAPVVRHAGRPRKTARSGLSDALLQFLLLDGRQDHTSCSTPQRAISTRSVEASDVVDVEQSQRRRQALSVSIHDCCRLSFARSRRPPV